MPSPTKTTRTTSTSATGNRASSSSDEGGQLNPTPPTTSDPAGSPAGRWLADPWQTLWEWAHGLWQLVGPVVVQAGTAAVGLLVTAVVGRALLRRQRAATLATGARVVTILPPPEVERAGAEVLWSNLAELLRPAWARLLEGQPHLAFELVWSAVRLRVALWVPGSVPPGLVERAVEAAWPGARTAVAEPDPPLPLEGSILGGELRLAAPEWFPLRTDHDADPLRPLLGAARGLGEEEAAAVQVLARPVTGRRLARSLRAAKALRTGLPLTRLGRLAHLVTPGPVGTPRPSEDPTRAPDIRAVLDKAGGPGWEVVVRCGVTSHRSGRHARRRLRGRAHALASAFGVYTGRNRLARRRLRRPGAALAARWMGGGDLVSVPELAALAHLPTDLAVPGLARAGARSVSPPPGIPTSGKVLGDADAGARRPVALDPSDARYHLHLLGATGSGKSTLLTNLVLSDVAARRGAVVIDPKGDLVVDILDRLPAEAAERVVLLDPDEADAPPTLNVLEGDDPDLVVDHLVGIFRRIFEAYWGPRTDDVLRSACLTLLRRPGATLAEVPRLLGDEGFRRPYVTGLRDQAGLGGFWSWYDAQSEGQRAQVVGPVLNKLRAFLLRDFVRSVVGSASSSFDLARVLDGGLCLVRVPKGIFGEDTARLLGSFVVAKVWQAATARARLGQTARAGASLYVDECQNFLTLPRSFDEMLAEARGYGLSLVLAHQHLAQLPRELREAVSANARTKVFFTLSPEDARALERHVAPELSDHDLAHLGAYQAAARLVVNGAELPAFTIATRPAPEAVPGRAGLVRARSKARFGRTEAQRRVEAARRRRSGGSSPGRSAGSSGGSLDLPASHRQKPPVRASITPAGETPDLGSEGG